MPRQRKETDRHALCGGAINDITWWLLFNYLFLIFNGKITKIKVKIKNKKLHIELHLRPNLFSEILTNNLKNSRINQ